MNTDPWWWHLSRQVTDVLDWLDETETGTNSNGYRNRDFEIDILTSHLVYHMICQNSSKFNLLLINLIKNLIIPWKYMYVQINWSYGRFHVSWDSEMCEFWRGNWPLDREGFSFPIFSGYLVSSVWLWLLLSIEYIQESGLSVLKSGQN